MGGKQSIPKNILSNIVKNIQQTSLPNIKETNTFANLTNKNIIENPSVIERFADKDDSSKIMKIFGYLLLMLIIIIVLIMSYCNNDVDLSSTSSGVFQKPAKQGFF